MGSKGAFEPTATVQAMKILVTGSRDWADYCAIYRALEPYVDEKDPPVVMHGYARGADLLASDAALDLGFRVQGYRADWDRHGKRAGIIRNLEMLDAEPDVVLAFRKAGSRGTTHCIEAAKKRGIPVVLHDVA